jgi:hypothetical protein
LSSSLIIFVDKSGINSAWNENLTHRRLAFGEIFK